MRPRLKCGIGHARFGTGGAILRFAVVACVVGLAIIAIGEALRSDAADPVAAPVAPAGDTLTADLARCRDITAEQLAADDTCRRVWTENRRRFFAPASRAAGNPDAPPKTQDRVPTSAAPTASNEAR